MEVSEYESNEKEYQSNDYLESIREVIVAGVHLCGTVAHLEFWIMGDSIS